MYSYETAGDDPPEEDVDLSCNCISTSSVMSSIRESNISSSKSRFGDFANRPSTRPPLVLPITATILINGHKAKTLFDSGSTADLISASFVDAHKIPHFKLEQPSPLQLAISGSRGKINRACHVKVSHGSCKEQQRYFDILNLDRYDVILGTSYQKDFGVMLDIATKQIVYKKVPQQKIPSMSIASLPDSGHKMPSAFGITTSKFAKAKTARPIVKPAPVKGLATAGPSLTSGIRVTKLIKTTGSSLQDLRDGWFEKPQVKCPSS